MVEPSSIAKSPRISGGTRDIGDRSLINSQEYERVGVKLTLVLKRTNEQRRDTLPVKLLNL